ncbi:MAG TPA: electron transfer flavoprotein subunit alpha/FixB family protein [Anaerolineae bacterium]|nr:electron transfer flavoprotein subunit alpha/FixB family protein [Anaerolineae bacterium]
MTRLTFSNAPHDIWIVAETIDGQLTPLTKELVYGARMSAGMMGFYVKVALLGSNVDELASELFPVGADHVVVIDDARLKDFSSDIWMQALSDLFAAQSPEFVLFGATSIGDALAPRLAHRFGAGLIGHCISLKVDDFDRCFIGRRSVYSGEYYEVISTAGSKSHFATVLPDTFGEPYPDASRSGEVEKTEVDLNQTVDRVRSLGSIPYELPRKKLKQARRIVSVGRQVGDVAAAKSLSLSIGAEFAGARESIDEGYIDEDHVIGITGERVAPDLYIALGIRGDTQHSFGMKDARYVVAVHPDPDAPMLKHADAAIIDDPARVAKELMQLINANQ